MVARYVERLRSDGSGSLRGKATGQSTLSGVLTPGAVPDGGMSIVYKFTIERRLRDIAKEIEHLNENLSGCDWCCGGGNARMKDLLRQKRNLEQRRTG